MGADLAAGRGSVTARPVPLTDEQGRVAPVQRRRAVRAIAGNHARNAADLALLIDALGLRPEEGLNP